MEVSLQYQIETYGLSEPIEHYLTHIGRIMSCLDFRNKAAILDKLAYNTIELAHATDAPKLVPGFRREYLEKEVA